MVTLDAHIVVKDQERDVRHLDILIQSNTVPSLLHSIFQSKSQGGGDGDVTSC